MTMSNEPLNAEPKLPIHGFVLAGGKSSRMGQDKALLPFRGRPMVEIAVEKLRTFCSAVSIAGNREDLSRFAPVAPESRLDCGPAAGIEAGLQACTEPWAMFMPVDVPLVPTQFLRIWLEQALGGNMTVSYLAAWKKQPAFCLLRPEMLRSFTAILETGERRLEVLLNKAAQSEKFSSWMYDPYDFYGAPPQYTGPDEETLDRWFWNVNTFQELAKAEQWADCSGIPE